jgi:formylglycine-generating enzyme required for sulfatase activity
MRSFLFCLCLCACAFLFADESSIQVLNVRTVPHWPWEGTVDVYYQVECDKEDADLVVSFAGYNADKDESVAMNPAYITGDGFEEDKPVVTGKELHAVWNAAADLPGYHCEDFAVIVTASYDDEENIYLVVDISGGSSATSYPYRYTSEAPDTTSDTCRTTELWLRKIPAGTFTMGSGSKGDTTVSMTLTQDFYIGVFECTQAQYKNIMGSASPSYSGDTRPMESVSYNTIRGSSSTAGSSTIMGKLSSKTGLSFDLPTEAQWEYACRKRADGSCWKTDFNSGKNLTGDTTCSNMAEVGRYSGNTSDGKGGYSANHTKVGSYLPSELGLYDMHGNVWEWCLDWYGTLPTTAQTDYTGPSAGSYRVARGGSWYSYAQYCRAANRDSDAPSSNDSSSGFRVACVPAP